MIGCSGECCFGVMYDLWYGVRMWFGLNLVQFNYVVLCVFSVLKRGRVVMGVCF